MRTANSRVRCDTENATRAYTPKQARTSASTPKPDISKAPNRSMPIESETIPAMLRARTAGTLASRRRAMPLITGTMASGSLAVRTTNTRLPFMNCPAETYSTCSAGFALRPVSRTFPTTPRSSIPGQNLQPLPHGIRLPVWRASSR
jgi:hypothetical protein